MLIARFLLSATTFPHLLSYYSWLQSKSLAKSSSQSVHENVTLFVWASLQPHSLQYTDSIYWLPSSTCTIFSVFRFEPLWMRNLFHPSQVGCLGDFLYKIPLAVSVDWHNVQVQMYKYHDSLLKQNLFSEKLWDLSCRFLKRKSKNGSVLRSLLEIWGLRVNVCGIPSSAISRLPYLGNHILDLTTCHTMPCVCNTPWLECTLYYIYFSNGCIFKC